MRLFTAINFSQSMRQSLMELQVKLQRQALRGNFSRPENLHLTLVFLGECRAGGLGEIKTALTNCLFEPFALLVDGVSRFSGRKGDTWIADLADCPGLVDLQHRQVKALASIGLELERRRYRPHITLAREVVLESVPWPWLIEPFGQIVESVELMISERKDGRLTYTSIHQVEAGS